MPQLVVLTGYPGSGKTWHANHQAEFAKFVKFVDEDPLSIDIFNTDHGLRAIIMALDVGCNCVIADCSCCHRDARAFLCRLVSSMCAANPVCISFRFFAPELDICRGNFLNNCDICNGNLNAGCTNNCPKRMNTLNHVSPYYADHIPPGAPTVPVEAHW